MKKIAVLLVCFSLCAGCSKDPYTASMQASLSVSDAVAQAIPIIQQLQTSNLITTEEAKQVYGYLQTVTVGNGVFRSTAKSLHASGTTSATAYLSAADTFVKGVDSPAVLASIHISNPASQQKVMTYLQAIDTVLNGITLAIQNNSTQPTPAPAVKGASLWTPISSQLSL